ncbi:unnamed protein product [marine sediment metagenome]|uniref:Uncharacterized protein n=1 Tax=marine sediment metagenome TaxID=412755 RepID=X0YX57_9ZZZZ
MDEHTGDAGIDTRLQAFFNTVKSYLEIEVKQTSKRDENRYLCCTSKREV